LKHSVHFIYVQLCSYCSGISISYVRLKMKWLLPGNNNLLQFKILSYQLFNKKINRIYVTSVWNSSTSVSTRTQYGLGNMQTSTITTIKKSKCLQCRTLKLIKTYLTTLCTEFSVLYPEITKFNIHYNRMTYLLVNTYALAPSPMPSQNPHTLFDNFTQCNIGLQLA